VSSTWTVSKVCLKFLRSKSPDRHFSRERSRLRAYLHRPVFKTRISNLAQSHERHAH
jgi:hypothetical protein